MESSNDLAKLTEREKVCLRQWLQHKSAKEIAVDLGISHHAVEKRLKMARLKLGVASSLQAAQMLDAAEGYQQAVPQTPALASSAGGGQSTFIRPLVLGAIAMSLIAATLLALMWQPLERSTPAAGDQRLIREYDQQLDAVLNALLTAAEIAPDGEIILRNPVADERFIRFGSGYYWQISGTGQEDFRSRSLAGRTLVPKVHTPSTAALSYESNQFPNEPLRVVERTVRLTGSDVEWRFMVARSCRELCR
ncbi:helix-turn-helix domain-containing protein [Sphingomonas sp. Leaf62]|uniref:helix-turn-helix domain-containing protein n=1 Tax=Sphingomonas sp. Leaf62 TaxID=1736228 RepID=UPI0007016C41|nr:helix-turn-helix domain-containing protein [Sphingomonas sp. Leaf62]KQN77342.1 hypothetical protein ASE91_15235 [Sphingomonas sp. Leaf62]